MTALAAAEMFVLTFAGCALLSRLLCAWVAPRVLEGIGGWDPTRRHVALLMLSAAPALVTGACFLAVLSPSIAALFMPSLDHCLVHDDGHAHLCFVHLPQHAPHVAIWACAAVISTLALFAMVHATVRIAASYRAARGLVRSTEPGSDGVHVLESNVPLCATVGLFRPKILVSRCVLNGLSPAERDALIAHERRHVQRRDALTRVLAHTLALMYPSAIRMRMGMELALAAEQACDEAAARTVGDRLTVAEAIVRTERMMSTVPTAQLGLLAVGMGNLAIERRVHALMHPRPEQGRLTVWIVPIALLLLTLFTAGDALHHAVESLLSPVLQ